MNQDARIAISRRKWMAGALAVGGAAALPGLAWADTYPSRPIKLAVLSTPGALGDILSRILAKHLAVQLGQPVVVENKPGAGGHISHEYVARSAPDGHTILFGANQVFALGPVMFKKLGYDPATDLIPVGYYNQGMHWLITNSAVGVRNLDEFIAYAKAKGSAVNFGSGGIGHPLHLYAEQLQAGFGTRMTHVPYNGMTPAIQGLMTNEIQFLVTGVSDTISHVKSGRLQVLATCGSVIPELVPANVPHLEATRPDLAYPGWVGIFVPKGTPDSIVNRLNAVLNQLADNPAFQKEQQDTGNVPLKGTPQEVKARLAKDMKEIGELARKLNLGA
ncbi:MAG: tripartite tricarboxylate transporter substrate binding protein [Rhodoferax sp.]|nr:tripartite tricarboxylate transporter substrate binding protein [Rhodoferax sp.]